jgi:hypothetical protein
MELETHSMCYIINYHLNALASTSFFLHSCVVACTQLDLTTNDRINSFYRMA